MRSKDTSSGTDDGTATTGGHEAEFREFMVSRWGSLVRFAYGLTGDRGHAEDLAQTALAKAYASWPRIRRAEDPDAYVRRILINANHRRFRKRRVEERTGDAPATVCPASGPPRALMNNMGKPGPHDGVVLGEAAGGVTRVDVTFKDGTVQHLTPVIAYGHAFVGTYVPDGATVVSITSMTGTNG